MTRLSGIGFQTNLLRKSPIDGERLTSCESGETMTPEPIWGLVEECAEELTANVEFPLTRADLIAGVRRTRS